MGNSLSENKSRLESLDILRGFDLFMLVCAQPLLYWLLSRANGGLLGGLTTQLSHVDWIGFAAWDLIMPLFMFMAGVSMPFSFAKYSGEGVYWRIGKRVVLLFILGAIVQGNLLAFDLHKLRLYSNTLQAIGVGYLIASILLLNFKIRGQILATLLIFFAYWAALTFGGDFSKENNLAEIVDKIALGRWRDGVTWTQDVWCFSDSYHYTWLLSSLNFGVTVMLGAFAGTIMRGGADKLKNARMLLLVCLCLLASGWLLSFQMPIIKKIWSSSMTLWSGGLCFGLMAFFYWYIDCIGRGKWLGWLKIYGMNSIAAYVISMRVNFKSVPESLFYGLRDTLGEYYQLLINASQYAIVFLILLLLFRNKIFLKV